MRRGQAAIEYLFMIALALVMVLIAVRLMRRAVQTATQRINQTNEEVIQLLQNMTKG